MPIKATEEKMKSTYDKIKELRTIIKKALSSLIVDNYVLLDVPYYTNIGDTLIWEGTREFLKTLPHKCLYTASVETYKYRPLPKNTVILLQGGGNFGDLWRRHQELRQTVIKSYPNNRIIILPQTVFYNNNSFFTEDAKMLNSHKDLHICVRDTRSLNYLKKALTCNLLLVPDMAFCISQKTLDHYKQKGTDKVLFLKRNDQELREYDFSSYIAEKAEQLHIGDWPTMEKEFKTKVYLDKLIFHRKRLKRIPDIYADLIFRPFQVRKGIEFVSKHRKVYTTRLHMAILSVLLDKEIVFFDNSYGKNRSFYETWLKDVEKLKFVQ